MNKIYLAGPIDGVSVKWATAWRKKATKVLESYDYKVLDPTSGKDLNLPGINDNYYSPEQIVLADLGAIDEANIIIVDWRKLPLLRRIWNFITTGHSDPMRTGTTMEIRHAYTKGKFVYVFGTMRKGYWMRFHTDMFFHSLDDILKFIVHDELPEPSLRKGGITFGKP